MGKKTKKTENPNKSQSSIKIGSLIGGRYRVLHKIGEGGMSYVYLVINETVNKQWAVKEIKKDTNDVKKQILQQNLITETKILKQLHHPNLPSIVDIFKENGTILIVMDYIEGVTLDKKLKQRGEDGKIVIVPQPEEDVVKWALQICDVLNYLHSQNPPIIYRDTKPSNIMLKPDGNIVLIDFGTAREYRDERVEDTKLLGTKGFAAPEQFGGYGQSDARTDIYNLGATMYNLVTGHSPNIPPYKMFPIRHWDRSLSSGLEKIILKCTEPSPEDRYQNCMELAFDLKNYKNLTDDNMKSTERKFVGFISTTCLAVLFLIAGILTGHRASNLKTSQYDLMIKNAASASTEEAQIQNYEKAINISPSRLEAYMGLLNNTYLVDGRFTKKEAEQMNNILGTDDKNGLSHEEALRSQADLYSEFAYDMGLAYFYYYEETGNKQLSTPWFDIAKSSPTLNATKKQRAERFYRIADYYRSLSIVDKAGDTEVSFADYWKDLYEVTSNDIAAEDNTKTAIVMYKELLSQIVMHASEFQKAGVTKTDIEKGKILVQEGIENLKKGTLDEYDTQSIQELEELLNQANDSINTAFAERETEPETEESTATEESQNVAEETDDNAEAEAEIETEDIDIDTTEEEGEII